MAYNSIGRRKETWHTKRGLLAWVFRVLLTAGNIFYGENEKHWYFKSIKGIWAKKVPNFHFPPLSL